MRERERTPTWVFTFQMPAMAKAGLGQNLKTVNSVLVSQMGGRNPTNLRDSQCLPDLHWQEVEVRNWSWSLNPGTPVWEVSILIARLKLAAPSCFRKHNGDDMCLVTGPHRPPNTVLPEVLRNQGSIVGCNILTKSVNWLLCGSRMRWVI